MVVVTAMGVVRYFAMERERVLAIFYYNYIGMTQLMDVAGTCAVLKINLGADGGKETTSVFAQRLCSNLLHCFHLSS